MTKKFDVVIGNPPYQEEAQGGGTRDTPVYHLFMDAAYEVANKAVLITPARFLFNAGFTPKAWNVKMLSDQHLSVAHYESDSKKLFPGLTDPIKGGIAVTYRDAAATLGPIGSFAKHPELAVILSKVDDAGQPSIDNHVSSGRAYAFTAAMHAAHPEASDKMSSDAQFRVSTNSFEQLAFLFHQTTPDDAALAVVRSSPSRGMFVSPSRCPLKDRRRPPAARPADRGPPAGHAAGPAHRSGGAYISPPLVQSAFCARSSFSGVSGPTLRSYISP